MTGSTTTTTSILPPHIDIAFAEASAALPTCTANLMPFSIDYDGPAPIDSFLLHRADPSLSTSQETQSFISAFRGRAIQSTPLPLPPGFAAKVVYVSQVVQHRASTSATSAEEAQSQRQNAEAREQKRRRIAKQPPAKQQKFSMDSDDDEEENDDEQHGSEDDACSIRDPSPPAAAETESASEPKQAQDAGASITIQDIALVEHNHLTVWGPDGPVDKGDDSFFRTVGEWYAVVSPLLHA